MKQFLKIKLFACMFFVLKVSNSLFALDRPVQAFPVNGENYVRYDAIFQIKNQVPGATKYIYEIDSVNKFNSAFKIIDSTTSISWVKNVMKFGFGKKYFWRIKAKNNSETSGWSDTWSFSVQNAVLLYSPANGSTSTTISPNIQVETFGSQPEYLLEFDSVPQFNSAFKAVRFPTSSTPSVQLYQMPFGKKIYWRCRATNGWGDTSAFSEVWHLIIPSAPTLGTPTNGLTGLDTSVGYSVNRITGTQTQVYLSENENFTTPVLYSVYSGTFRKLKFGTTYYWKARNYTGTSNYSEWTQTNKFTTKFQLSVPTVTSPSTNASINADTVDFQWLAVSPQPVTGYFIQVDTNAGFSTPSEYFSATLQFRLSGLMQGKKYYYRIKAMNDLGIGPWSAVRSFTFIGKINSANRIYDNNFKIYYSNKALYILDIPTSIKELAIIDMQGRIVRKYEGVQEFYVLENIANGIYFAEIILVDNSFLKRKFQLIQ